ncbi:hypothetical protein FQZ97_1208750 [compost metagenome]
MVEPQGLASAALAAPLHALHAAGPGHAGAAVEDQAAVLRKGPVGWRHFVADAGKGDGQHGAQNAQKKATDGAEGGVIHAITAGGFFGP